MKFLCLCHYESARFAELKPADFEEIGAICAPHDAALKASGKVEMVGALGMPEQSRTLRVEGGAVTDTAGPFKQMPEPFGAFFIVEAADIDEAVAVAKLHPGTHLGEKFGEGGIEVRPIDFVEQP
ncbi:MAG TPA: YciI family protein [Sphingomonas sp.]